MGATRGGGARHGAVETRRRVGSLSYVAAANVLEYTVCVSYSHVPCGVCCVSRAVASSGRFSTSFLHVNHLVFHQKTHPPASRVPSITLSLISFSREYRKKKKNAAATNQNHTHNMHMCMCMCVHMCPCEWALLSQPLRAQLSCDARPPQAKKILRQP